MSSPSIVFKLSFLDGNGVAVGGSRFYRVKSTSSIEDIETLANLAAFGIRSKFTSEFAQLFTPDCNFDIFYTGY